MWHLKCFFLLHFFPIPGFNIEGKSRSAGSARLFTLISISCEKDDEKACCQETQTHLQDQGQRRLDEARAHISTRLNINVSVHCRCWFPRILENQIITVFLKHPSQMLNFPLHNTRYSMNLSAQTCSRSWASAWKGQKCVPKPWRQWEIVTDISRWIKWNKCQRITLTS